MAESTSSGTTPAAGVVCSGCSAPNAAGQTFCGTCGSRLVIDLTDGAVIPGQRQPELPVAEVADAAVEIPRQEPWPSALPEVAAADVAPADTAAPVVQPQWPSDGQWPADPQWPGAAPAGQQWPQQQWPVQEQWPQQQWPVQQQWARQGGFAEPTQLGHIPAQYQPEPHIGRPAPAAPQLPHGWQPAGFGQRFAARLLDAVVVLVLTVALYLGLVALAGVLGVDEVGAGFLIGALLLALFLPGVLNLVYRIGSDFGLGRSLGRAAVGIRLVKLPRLTAETPVPPADELAHVGFGTVLGRLIVSGLGDWLFFLNSFSMLWDAQSRTWGDRASNTAVVLDDAGEKRSAWTPPAVAAALTGAMCFGLVLLGNTGPSLDDVSTTAADTQTGPGTVFDAPSATPHTVAPSYTPPTSTYTPPPTTNYDPNAGDPGISQYAPNVPYDSGSSSTYPVKEDIWLRSGPSRGAAQLTLLPAGSTVSIECQLEGDYITTPTGASSYWDRVTTDSVTGYVSDEYVATNTTGTNNTVAPPCS